jgi:hypothetical protein
MTGRKSREENPTRKIGEKREKKRAQRGRRNKSCL